MNCKKLTVLRSLLVLATGLLALPAFAVRQEAVLGNNGELYMVKTGTYSALFPTGHGSDDGANPVLALDVARPGKPIERLLVPATNSDDVEVSPTVIFEADSNTVFLVWESRVNAIHSILKLVSFESGNSWSAPIEVNGNSYATKTPPQLATTRDSYQGTDGEGKPVLKHRTVLHLTWSQETGSGLYEALYTPIILDEGTYIGWNPLFNLSSFEKSTEAAGAPAPAELMRSPAVQAGRDGRTILVAFTSALTGHLVSLEVDVLPTQLRLIADKARAYIIDLGARLKPDLAGVAAKARDFIANSGGEFQPEVAQSMAALVYNRILHRGGSPAAPPGDLKPIADDARAYIIDLGAKFSGRGLKMAADDSTARIVEIPQSQTPDAEEDGKLAPGHLFQMRIAASRQAPVIGAGAVRVFVSDTGSTSLVSWATGDRVYYRDSQGSGWSEVRDLKISAGFDLNKAYEVLAQRVQNR